MKFSNNLKSSIRSDIHSLQEAEKIKEQEKTKKQYKHDYFVVFLSTILGGITGLATSLIFWLITGNH